jgi:hypothetical protein
MTQIVPHRWLFRFSIPVRHVVDVPREGDEWLALPPGCALPDFGELDAAPPFGELRMAWNAGGLGISVQVAGKTRPLHCRASTPEDSDGLQVWIDTRNTQSIHRASRFCHHFCLLPAGAGRRGDQPAVVQLPIARAREDAPLTAPGDFRSAVAIRPDGYRLDAWLPAAALHGFDVEASPRLGFYYSLRDAELGEQYLTVGPEFPFAHDPSLWATLELTQ